MARPIDSRGIQEQRQISVAGFHSLLFWEIRRDCCHGVCSFGGRYSAHSSSHNRLSCHASLLSSSRLSLFSHLFSPSLSFSLLSFSSLFSLFLLSSPHLPHVFSRYCGKRVRDPGQQVQDVRRGWTKKRAQEVDSLLRESYRRAVCWSAERIRHGHHTFFSLSQQMYGEVIISITPSSLILYVVMTR